MLLHRCAAIGLVTVAFGLAPAAADTLFPDSMPWDDVSANLTNLSGWNDRPAGRDGFVTVRDGHLAVGSRRLRLLGVNIVFGAAMPSHDDAEHLAPHLARLGINIVRFHHMDTRPAPDGLLQADMRTLDPAQLDKLDYFIAALKRQGIYADLNLHVGRSYPGFTPGRNTQGTAVPAYWKGVDLFFAPMIALQQDYARDLLTHRNPFTGNRYVDEPAVALIEINNEDGLISEWRRGSLDGLAEPFRAALQQRWITWLRQRYSDTPALARAWGARDQPLGVERLSRAAVMKPGEPGWALQSVGDARAHFDAAPGGDVIPLAIDQTDGTSWHVQLHQTGLAFKAGEPYTLRLRLRADRPRRVRVTAMQAHAPWHSLWQTTLDIGPEWRDDTITFSPSDDEPMARLTLGDLGAQTGTVWLAGSSLRPGGRLGLKLGETLEQGTIATAGSADFQNRTVEGQRDWIRFLWDTEEAYWSGMQRDIRVALGAHALIVGTPVSYSPAPIQAGLDVVDGHAYWQHPHFPGKPWDPDNWTLANSPMAGIDGAGTLTDLALRRVAGKPFIVTEYNHPAPGEYAAEALPLVAAYAGLQDWDGIFVFDYGAQNRNWNPGAITNFFDIDADPNKLAGLGVAAALFRRGDVATPGVDAGPRPDRAAMVDALRLHPAMPGAMTWGAALNQAVRGPVSLASPATAPLPLPVRSITGQLVWGADTGRTVTIDTPRSKGLIGARLAGPIDAGGVGLELLQARHDTGVLCATLIDGRDFTSPGHILITALGAEQNTGQVWQDATHTSLGRHWGGAPVLVEAIRARITLPVPASRVAAWALDSRGNRRQALAVTGDHRTVIEIGGDPVSLRYEVEIR